MDIFPNQNNKTQKNLFFCKEEMEKNQKNEQHSTTNKSNAAAPRVVIIGGIAGGASAAARLMRLNYKIHVILIEKSPHVSIATSGTPYYIGGEIKEEDALHVQSATSLQNALGIAEVRTNTEAVKIDRKRKIVYTVDNSSSTVAVNQQKEEQIPYDYLIIATGASPFVPPQLTSALQDPKVGPYVKTLRSVGDMESIVNALGGRKKVGVASSTTIPADPKKSQAHPINVTVVGAGFTGIELSEQLSKLGHKVTIVERHPTVLQVCDDEIGALLHPVLRDQNVTLITNDGVKNIHGTDQKKNKASKKGEITPSANSPEAPIVIIETESGKKIESNLVILCTGVSAESSLAKKCGLKISNKYPHNHLICVDNHMRTSDPAIYAVGDATETSDGVFRDVKAWTPLATVASMQARIAADHIATGKSIPFRGSFSTAIVRCFGFAVATTGWSERRLKANKTPFAVSVVNAWSTAPYYPNPKHVLIKMTYCPTTGRIFGGQVFGAANAGVDKRIDVIATALLGNLTIHELSHGQFAYSPPFGTAKDPVNLVCLNARNINDGLTHATTRLDPSVTIVDVRPEAAFKNDPVTTAASNQRTRHLFWASSKKGSKDLFDELKNNSKQSAASTAQDSDGKKLVGAHDKFQSLCFWGRTSYFAHRNMLQAGLKTTTLQGGNAYAKGLKEAERCGSKL